MAALPHDIADLYLAPVLLAVDARIEELARLDIGELALEVGVTSDRPDWSRDVREEGLIAAIGYSIDCHGWTFSWDPRGLRLTNEPRTVVLGVPPNFAQYLAGASRSTG